MLGEIIGLAIITYGVVIFYLLESAFDRDGI